MTKILSQSGISLADTYNVEGSIAGIEQLESREVSLVHDMAVTLFSERVSGFIRRAGTGDILQNVEWDIVLSDLPTTPFRILDVLIFTNNPANLLTAAVFARDPGSDREIPLHVWDLNEPTVNLRLQDNGDAVAQKAGLVSAIGTTPSMMWGSGQPQSVQEIAFRGETSAFGAGTVETVALIYIAFSQTGGLSSHGLPIPGW